MVNLAGEKSVTKSGTVWGVLLAVVGPMILAKTGLTPDEVLNTTNMVIAAGAGLFAIFKRIRAKKKITTVV